MKKAGRAKIKCATAIVIAVILLVPFVQGFSPLEEISDFISGMAAAIIDEIEDEPNSTIAVAAIRMQRKDFSIGNLKSKLGALFKAHPTVDLVVTPEYVLYDEYKSNPVKIDCISGLCSVQSIGSSKSLELKLAIREIRLIARQKNANIMLGTIAELETSSTHGIVYNTMLVISSEGIIIGKTRKYMEILLLEELLNPRLCILKPSYCSVVKEPASFFALESMKPFSLVSSGGAEFKTLPVICADKNSKRVMEKMSGSNADMVALSELTATQYTKLTESAAKGEDIFRGSNGNAQLIKNLFFVEYLNKNITKENSYLIASNSEPKGGSAGILSISRKEIRNLDITDDFVYGEITIDLHEISESEAGEPFEESPAQVFDEKRDDNISEKVSDNESLSKQEENEIQKKGIFSRIKNFILGIFS